MDSDQQRLVGPGRGPRELVDFVGLLDGVMPSRFYVLQQGDNLLFYKHLEYGSKELGRPVRRVIDLLLRHAKQSEIGNVTVVIAQPVQVTTRHVRWFDWTGKTEIAEMTVDDFRRSILTWFHDSRRRR